MNLEIMARPPHPCASSSPEMVNECHRAERLVRPHPCTSSSSRIVNEYHCTPISKAKRTNLRCNLERMMVCKFVYIECAEGII
jgi:hypothetical protein